MTREPRPTLGARYVHTRDDALIERVIQRKRMLAEHVAEPLRVGGGK